MNNILEVLDKFLASVGKVRAEIAKAISDHQARVTKLENDKMALAGDIAKLDQREAEVKKVENVIAFKEEAKELMKKAMDTQTALDKERDSFDAFKVEETKKILTQKNELNEQAKQQKTESEDLKKGRELLKQDKETYKDKVAKSIVDLANKK